MTTESAPAPHHTRHPVAVPAPATPLRAPRRAAHRHRTAPHTRPGLRAARRLGPAVGLCAADVFALAGTVALIPPLPWPVAALVWAAALQPVLHVCRGLNRPSLSPSALADVPVLAVLALVQWLVLSEALAAYDPQHAVAWRTVLLAVLIQTLLCCGARALVYAVRRRRGARRPQSVLVVGTGAVAHQVTVALLERPRYGMRPVGRIGTTDADTLPQLTTVEDVSRAVVQNDVRHAVFTRQPGADHESSALIALFAAHGCRLWLVDGGAAVGNLWRCVAGRDHLWGFSVQPLRAGLHRPVARAVKRAIDIVLAGAALVVAAPVLAVCALAVRLSDGPGVIFRQERIGLDGHPFTLLKFRTLAPADDHESATLWNIAYDRRMSATGSVLRRTSLDELPQLWNVVRGDMSLVGPRPERPYYVGKFSHAHPGYQARHRMPVGLTGLAQVHGLRGDTSIEERARFDNHYIDTWSPWQDVCIMARTAATLFRLGGS
ncbi:exopolysaccharide biosynthesis polyprenyl glycosylphosphotransferase [Streptomyces sp. NPDC047315]|uniref:exopolysaccharide biosynthesis polyprenyl glycosylphosphotransferase n=1 Tax=Streptomyces sp. NPDC047315 TaxID=3155142 RepID=UPI0033F0D61F